MIALTCILSFYLHLEFNYFDLQFAFYEELCEIYLIWWFKFIADACLLLICLVMLLPEALMADGNCQ